MSEHAGGRRRTGPADPRANTLVKRVLRTGLGVSLVLLAAGLAVQLAGGHDRAAPVRMFDLFAARLPGERIMGLGVLTLALTPAAGVVSVVASWLRERDRLFVAVGLLVAIVLTSAVLVGLRG